MAVRAIYENAFRVSRRALEGRPVVFGRLIQGRVVALAGPIYAGAMRFVMREQRLGKDEVLRCVDINGACLRNEVTNPLRPVSVFIG